MTKVLPPTQPNSTLPKAVLLIISNDRPDGGNNHPITQFNDGAPLRLTHTEPTHFGPVMGIHRFGYQIQKIAADAGATSIIMSDEDLAGTS